MKKSPLKRKPFKAKRTPLKSGGKKAINKTPLKNQRTKLKQNGIQKNKSNKPRKRNLKRKQIRKDSANPLSREIKLCDNVFSKYVRLLNSDSRGIVKCFTCEYKANWQRAGIQCSHFKSRGHYSTRWLKLNCEPGCVQCNEFLSGNLKVFAERLVAKHGPGILEYLDQESKKTVKLTVEKVKQLRLYFEEQVVKLKQKLNL